MVFDVESGLGLRSAQVTIEGSGIGALTDTLGRFTLRGVMPGSARLVFEQVGYRAIREDIVLEEGRALTVTAGIVATPVPLCGLIVCAGPYGCYAFEVVVRDIETGVAPQGEVALLVSGREATDSMSLHGAPDLAFLHLGAGGDMIHSGPSFDGGPYDIEVRAPGYSSWVEHDVQRGACWRFSGNPRFVWLVPSG